MSVVLLSGQCAAGYMRVSDATPCGNHSHFLVLTAEPYIYSAVRTAGLHALTAVLQSTRLPVFSGLVK